MLRSSSGFHFSKSTQHPTRYKPYATRCCSWVHLVVTYCEVAASFAVDLLEACSLAQVRFEFTLYDIVHNVVDGWAADMVARVLADPVTRTDAHLVSVAAQRIIALADSACHLLQHGHVDIPIAVRISGDVKNPFLGSLRSAMKALQKKHEC